MLDYQALYPLGLKPGVPGAKDYLLRTEPPKQGRYRVILFMGQGYTACEVDSDAGGSLSLRKILEAPSTRSGKGDYVAFQVAVGLDLDVDPRPLVLIERISPSTGRPAALPEGLLLLPLHRSALDFFMGRKR